MNCYITSICGEIMSDNYRLKIKIGEHEFEAEGAADVVQQQFAAFKDLISAVPTKAKEEHVPNEKPVPAEGNGAIPLPHLPLEKIMRVEGRRISLTAKCESVADAVLLILLGQRDFRSNEQVSGAEIMDGLKQSGYIVPRVDLMLDKLSTEGTVIVIGIHRARRYRLTNQGAKRALEIAKNVLALV